MTTASTTPAPSSTTALPHPVVEPPCAHATGVSRMLASLSETLEPQRRLVRAGDVVYRAGETFCHLYVLNSGFMKIVKPTADGREQLVGLKFRGDWMGFDGIAHGSYGCDGIAMDTGEVWSIRYDALRVACAKDLSMMTLLHEAMSREISRERESLLSVCTLPADARVADFLHGWAESAARRGLRTDEITLRLTRAEIGNFLGLTLESVSRAFSKLARSDVIGFTGKGRRDIRIPDVKALAAFVQGALVPQRAAC